MRIAEISCFLNFSVGKVMKDIKNFIDVNTNDKCEIFYARGSYVKEEGVNYVGSRFRVSVNALMARIFDNDGFCTKHITRNLIKKLEAFKPNVVHLHCLHGYYLNIELLFDYLRVNQDIKVIWTMHDTWAFTGHCCYFDMACCDKWTKQCGRCPCKRDYPTSILFDFSYKNFKRKRKIFEGFDKTRITLISPSYWLDSLIGKSFLSQLNRKVINNGIDLNIFNTDKNDRKLNFFQKKVLLGVASVWDERKGLKFFIELAKIIGNDWIICIIGKSSFNFKKFTNIIHIQRTNSQTDLKLYYQSSTVLLNPSLSDNYPTVNLEAQACGCKVVCFNTGGSCETNFGNLYIYDFDTYSNLACFIEKISCNKSNIVNYKGLDKKIMAQQYYLSMKHESNY